MFRGFAYKPRSSFRALGEPGARRVPAREPCDPESMSGSAQAERWIPDSAVCRAGFLRNPGQTGFRNDTQWLRRFHMRLPGASAGVQPLDQPEQAMQRTFPDAERVEMSDRILQIVAVRSEERRVGKGCVSTVRSRGSPDH